MKCPTCKGELVVQLSIIREFKTDDKGNVILESQMDTTDWVDTYVVCDCIDCNEAVTLNLETEDDKIISGKVIRQGAQVR